jgi:hypothetical protein
MSNLPLSYLTLLKNHADRRGVNLLAAVLAAGMPDSTFYRWNNGTMEPRYDKTVQVWKSIDAIAEAASADRR